jgi:orotidine-5'-phosphate decarboxylase
VAAVKRRASTGRAGRATGTAADRFARLPEAIVALDVPTSAGAVRLVEQLGSACSFYKVGSELFAASGPAIVDYLRARGARVFLDLKLHDIPNTVERAAAVAASSGVSLLTVHAVGGLDMMRAAVVGAAAGTAAGATPCAVLAVTVLTSLDASRLGDAWGRKLTSVEKEVLRLAGLAQRARAAGVVCSGAELPGLRARFGERLQLLVPGVRLARAARGDQVRVITPGAAAAGGADYVVIGRAVTLARDPAAALQAIKEELKQGVTQGR